MKPVVFADDPQFWFETLRTMGHAAYGGADIGEVLTTAQNIVAGDYDSWHDQWLATADRIAAEAETQLAAGHRTSARDGLLRASNYYRAAEFFLHGNPADPRIDHAYRRATQCFQAAAALFTPAIEVVEIPYEDTVLHGYFYRAAGSEGDGTPRPTMVLHNGFDGGAEEMHYSGAAAGSERGYHVLTFDGPGHPAARHLDGLVFRPDWENVVTPVLDWVMARPEVDQSRVGLLGLSMGGLLAPRAAAFEHRLAACVADDGVYELGSTVLSHFPGSRADSRGRSAGRQRPRRRRRDGTPHGDRPDRALGHHQRHVRHGCGLTARLCRLLSRLHPRRRHRRADHLPDPGVRRRDRHVLARPAPETVRPPDLPEDSAAVHQRRGRRRPLLSSALSDWPTPGSTTGSTTPWRSATDRRPQEASTMTARFLDRYEQTRPAIYGQAERARHQPGCPGNHALAVTRTARVLVSRLCYSRSSDS